MSVGISRTKHPTLSIVVTAHSESILLHRTLRSALRATALLDAHEVSWELLIHVDNATKETNDYIAANRAFLEPLPLYRNSFGDLGASRNFMITKARGAYITFLDADDLISQNWFYEGVAYLQKRDKPTVVHTEWLVNFGKQNLAWQKYNSRSKQEDALIMVWANRWDSAVIAPRSVFEQFPYAANKAGFGSEDWHFSSQTLAADIPHHVVPHTVIFARRKDVSEMSIQKSDFRTVQYTNLLDVFFFKDINVQKILGERTAAAPRHSVKLKAKRAVSTSLKTSYRLVRKMPVARQFAQSLVRYARSKRTQEATHFPAWLIAEWRALHAVDKQVFPEPELLRTMPLYISEMYEMGVTYQKLTGCVTKYPDYIVVVPHLVPGGADLVVLNYVRALQTIHPDWHILVIATNDTPSPWATRLPDNVDYMPWGEICTATGLWQDLHLQLFARLVVQLKCKRLHIIQSALGFSFAEKYKHMLAANDYRVYACAFCEDVDDEGRFIGHVHSGLPGAYPALDKILTDNQAIVTQLVHEYGFDPNKFTVHYQPAELAAVQPPHVQHSKPYRILWASRVARQKRPDILREIARRLSPDDFAIDIYGTLHEGFTPEYFDSLPAARYMGGFDGLGSLDLAQYDAFLYTSANDGVPNILLGIAAAGLPIVASNDGGVGEFIKDHQTGFLINPLDDIAAYVRALEELRAQPELAQTLATNAQHLLKTRHSEAAFVQAVRKTEL